MSSAQAPRAMSGVDPLFDPSVVEHPHGYYSQLRQSDPVHLVEGTNAYLVTRLDLILEVVADPALYSSRSSEFLHLSDSGEPELRSPGGTSVGDESTLSVLATADPPDHGRQRKVLSRVLSTGGINAREGEFRELIDGALDRPLASGRVEWMSEIAEPLSMVMVARLLGVPDSTAPLLKEQGYASVELIGGFVPENLRPGLEAKMTELGSVIEAVVILGLLLAAGGESTTSLLGTGARILAERPELQDRLRAHLDLIPAFVEEACRVWPAANRDLDAHPHADEIDIDRPNPRNHVGFGWGIHLCIGAPLARLEARVTFERLLARTASFSVEAPPDPLHHHRSLMIRRLVELPLTLITEKIDPGRPPPAPLQGRTA